MGFDKSVIFEVGKKCQLFAASYSFQYFYVCVHMCADTHSHVCRHSSHVCKYTFTCVHVLVEPRIQHGCLLQMLSVLSFDTRCLTEPGPYQIDCLTSKSQGSSCLHLPGTGITSECCHAWLFTWILEGLVFHDKHCHRSAPVPNFNLKLCLFVY